MESPRTFQAKTSDSHTAEHALHHALSMTKDLEELMENVNIAEQIARRPSTSTTASDISDKSIASVFSPRSSRLIEPIPAFQKPVKSSPTLSDASIHSLHALKQNMSQCNGVIEKDVSSNKNRRFSANASSYRTHGSLTTSEEDEDPTTSPKVAGSYSASGALVTSFATQTPEDLDSSDSEQAPTEPEQGEKAGRSKGHSSSSSSSTSSEEEWDSEADTHTSVSDEEEGTSSRKKAPTASYYQVIDTKALANQKAVTTSKGRASRSPVPSINANQHIPPPVPRQQPQPWLDRYQQSRAPLSLPLPTPQGTARARPLGLARTQSALSSSRSFPQGFLPGNMPLSNPFLSTSLHEAYRQACAFKLWYEETFPDQAEVGFNGISGGNNVATNRRANGSVDSGSRAGAPHSLPQLNTLQPATQRLYSR